MPVVWETRFNPRLSHIKDSKKWYLMLLCLTLSIIRYGSRIKRSYIENGVVPSPTLCCSSYWKGRLWSPTLHLKSEISHHSNNFLFTLFDKEISPPLHLLLCGPKEDKLNRPKYCDKKYWHKQWNQQFKQLKIIKSSTLLVHLKKTVKWVGQNIMIIMIMKI